MWSYCSGRQIMFLSFNEFLYYHQQLSQKIFCIPLIIFISKIWMYREALFGIVWLFSIIFSPIVTCSLHDVNENIKHHSFVNLWYIIKSNASQYYLKYIVLCKSISIQYCSKIKDSCMYVLPIALMFLMVSVALIIWWWYRVCTEVIQSENWYQAKSLCTTAVIEKVHNPALWKM